MLIRIFSQLVLTTVQSLFIISGTHRHIGAQQEKWSTSKTLNVTKQRKHLELIKRSINRSQKLIERARKVSDALFTALSFIITMMHSCQQWLAGNSQTTSSICWGSLLCWYTSLELNSTVAFIQPLSYFTFYWRTLTHLHSVSGGGRSLCFYCSCKSFPVKPMFWIWKQPQWMWLHH